MKNFWSSIISKELHTTLSRQHTKINADEKNLTNEKTKVVLQFIITKDAIYFRLTDDVSFNRKGINVKVGSNLGSYAQNDDINNINLGK